MTVLAAFKVLLAKYSSRDDLVVGTPSSGRHRPELQGNTVGCFVNLTALRTSLAGKVLWKHSAMHRPCEAFRSCIQVSVVGSSSEPLVLMCQYRFSTAKTNTATHQIFSCTVQSETVLDTAIRHCVALLTTLQWEVTLCT